MTIDCLSGFGNARLERKYAKNIQTSDRNKLFSKIIPFVFSFLVLPEVNQTQHCADNKRLWLVENYVM